MSNLPTRYYLLCGDEEAIGRFNKGVELLRERGHNPILSTCPVASSINVTELRINPELASAETLARGLALAAGVCLIQQ